MKTSRSSSSSPQRQSSPQAGASLRGASQLIIDAVLGVTDIVESTHRNISGLAPLVGPSRPGRTKGITGLVYRSVRGVSRAVGLGLDAAFAQLAPVVESRPASPQVEAVMSALNGVFGDYLLASTNPLAIAMQLRQNGQALTLDKLALTDSLSHPTRKVMVLVHGLCMNDLQWQRQGHDHGSLLARAHGFTPLYLHYNSGLHISHNGRQFADLLEALVSNWPMPVDELLIIGHSMGGLVSRSACHYATLAGHTWPRRLKKLICLGTPHTGAPLERAGSWVDMILGISPYTAPLARLGTIRSAGVKDLRHGYLVDEDWQRTSPGRISEPRAPVKLPKGVRCFVVAATTQQRPSGAGVRLRGDGLVPVTSALGQHKDAALSLPIPASRQFIAYGLNHFDLLSNRDVFDQLNRWLQAG